MRIKLSHAGKRFNREWIFRNAILEFDNPGAYAITGPNGSGKSTLLQCIGGMLQLSEGTIAFEKKDTAVPAENTSRPISFCAPYLDLIEEMTLAEFLAFHNRFKAFLPPFSIAEIIRTIGLEAATGKQIRYFSSGMKQRVKLAQAIFSDTDVVLLDEPCSNLDQKGIDLYHHLVAFHCKDRLVIVCSNDPVEYAFCTELVEMSRLKEGG